MHRHRRILPLLLALAFSVPMGPAGAAHGEDLFLDVCSACHKSERSPAMIAPPIFGVKRHYLDAYPDRDDFIRALATWLIEPAEARSLMPGAIRRFGIMPKQNLSPMQALSVAAYIYDTDFETPADFEEHYRKEHGQRPAPSGQ